METGSPSSTTAPLAEAAHTTLSNALTTPTAKDLHTEKPAGATTRASNIVIRDPAELARKRVRMIAGGARNLQVIADFDRTISAFKTRSGEMCASDSWTRHHHQLHQHRRRRKLVREVKAAAAPPPPPSRGRAFRTTKPGQLLCDQDPKMST
jgi:hypothetical protein